MSPTLVLSDRDAIVAHIHGLFRAYMQKDRTAIRLGHTSDWRGFQIRSDHIVRGIDEYMGVAEQVLEKFQATSYELLDVDVQVKGDIAIVFYVARETIRVDGGQEKEIRLRSVDIYRREDGVWNQCGSNICLVPEAKPDAAITILSPVEREELLVVRESVWRAWFANDSEALDQLIPNETMAFNAAEPDWHDRKSVIAGSAKFAGSGGRLIRLEFPHTQIQCYGSVAILYTTYLFETETVGQRRISSGRGTEVFVRSDGKWRNSGWHLDSGS